MPLKRLNCTLSPAINVLKWDRINFWAYWVALWGQSAIGVSPCAIKLCRSPAQVMIQALARKEPSSASFTEYKSLLCQFWPFIWPQMMFRVTTTGPKVILKFQNFGWKPHQKLKKVKIFPLAALEGPVFGLSKFSDFGKFSKMFSSRNVTFMRLRPKRLAVSIFPASKSCPP